MLLGSLLLPVMKSSKSLLILWRSVHPCKLGRMPLQPTPQLPLYPGPLSVAVGEGSELSLVDGWIDHLIDWQVDQFMDFPRKAKQAS